MVTPRVEHFLLLPGELPALDFIVGGDLTRLGLRQTLPLTSQLPRPGHGTLLVLLRDLGLSKDSH